MKKNEFKKHVRIVALGLVFAMAMAGAGCGKQKPQENTEVEVTTEATEEKSTTDANNEDEIIPEYYTVNTLPAASAAYMIPSAIESGTVHVYADDADFEIEGATLTEVKSALNNGFQCSSEKIEGDEKEAILNPTGGIKVTLNCPDKGDYVFYLTYNNKSYVLDGDNLYKINADNFDMQLTSLAITYASITDEMDVEIDESRVGDYTNAGAIPTFLGDAMYIVDIVSCQVYDAPYSGNKPKYVSEEHMDEVRKILDEISEYEDTSISNNDTAAVFKDQLTCVVQMKNTGESTGYEDFIEIVKAKDNKCYLVYKGFMYELTSDKAAEKIDEIVKLVNNGTSETN